jgi:hypothetical protein
VTRGVDICGVRADFPAPEGPIIKILSAVRDSSDAMEDVCSSRRWCFLEVATGINVVGLAKQARRHKIQKSSTHLTCGIRGRDMGNPFFDFGI